MSQAGLGESAGITFQQVQKYERGMNRISASRLYAVSSALGVEISCFFDGLPEDVKARYNPPDHAVVFMQMSEGPELVRLFRRLTPAKRRGVLALVRHITEDEA